MLRDEEIGLLATGAIDAAAACRALVEAANRRGTADALVEAANRRGTADDLTAADLRVLGAVPEPPRQGLTARPRGLFRG